uniref:G_PROTEIN_RECEP_F1_2 domain-containing protein n=1 Tax=Steinernema glaseri TaxID=37863 RepID=A0A1I8AMC0_9BILA
MLTGYSYIQSSCAAFSPLAFVLLLSPVAVMNEGIAFFYNRILDVTAFGSIATKPLCIYIVITKTPKYMRTVSYFILNELLWSFTVNLLYSLGHPLPMMPAMCFRMDGLAAEWIKSEVQQLLYFIAIILSAVNFTVGLVNTFIYRYVTLHFSAISRFHRICGCALFVVAHLMMSLFVAFLFRFFQIPVLEYPERNLLEDSRNVFCLDPHTNILFYAIFLFFACMSILLALFAGLSIRELRMKIHAMKKKTLHMQKEIQRNLLVITGWSVLVGFIPMFIFILFVCHGKWPYARSIALISMMLPLNHGTFYAALILYLFKPYRKAIVDILKAFKSISIKALPICCSRKITNTVVMSGKNVKY